MAAARGCLALVRGNRGASEYFDFSQRGLVGSFIAFLLATVFNAYLPMVLGLTIQPGSISRGLLMVGGLFALQVGFSALVLRQMGRLDGFRPYLIADNWATFFITILSAVLAVVGLGGDAAMLGIGILVIVVEINIARLIVRLAGLQIAMLLVAQLVGVSIGLLLLGGLMPVPPEVASQLTPQ